MNRLILTGTTVLICALPALAQVDSDSSAPERQRRTTFASVRALASTSGAAMSEPDRSDDRRTVNSVRDLVGATKDEKQDAAEKPPAEKPKPAEAKPKARKDAREKNEVNDEKKPVPRQARKQAAERRQIDLARQQGGLGLQPWGGDPWIGGWGNGFQSNRIVGYRSYRYSGYGNGYGWPYYYPGYGYGYGYGYGFGFGFSPVMPSISGPVTTRYADPVGRQYKMMDDAIRKFAEGK